MVYLTKHHGVFMKISSWYIAVLFFCLIAPFVVWAQPIGTSSTCGNAKLEGTEACDDGNTADNDGCSSQCLREVADGVCGNGNIDKYEQCDDGNNISGDDCTATCGQEFCHDNTVTPPTYLTTMDTAYYAGVACPSQQPIPVDNIPSNTISCSSGETASSSLCAVDTNSQLKCFSKDSELGVATGSVADLAIVGADNSIVVATADNGIHIINTAKQAVIQHLTYEQSGAVKSIAVAKDNLYILNDKNEIIKTNEIRTAEVIYTSKKTPLVITSVKEDNDFYILNSDATITAIVFNNDGTLKKEEEFSLKSIPNIAAVDVVAVAVADLLQKDTYTKKLFVVDKYNNQILVMEGSINAKLETLIKDLPFSPNALTLDKDKYLVTDNSLPEKMYSIDSKFTVSEIPLTGVVQPHKAVATQLCSFGAIDVLPIIKTPICSENSSYNPDSALCECVSGHSWQLNPNTNEGACLPEVILEPVCPENSTFNDATTKCECDIGFIGTVSSDLKGTILTCTADTKPVEPVCPQDSSFNETTQICECNSGFTAKVLDKGQLYCEVDKIPEVVTCPENSILNATTGKCECNADFVAKVTTDANGVPSLACVSLALNQCPDGLSFSDTTGKCECPEGSQIVVQTDKSLICETKPAIEPLCPENSSFDESKKQCECTTGYIMQKIDKGIICVENPDLTLLCPENSTFNDVTEKCECDEDYTASVTVNDNGIPSLVCTSKDPTIPSKPEIEECPDKASWNDEIADCACEEGLVAIRDCNSEIIRCISPKDTCGCQDDDKIITNTTITNTNITDVTKVINVTNTTTISNTNTNVTISGNTQSKTPVINTGSSASSSSSGSFADSIDGAFTAATATDGDLDGADTNDDDIGDVNAATGDVPSDGDTGTVEQENAALSGGVSCSLTQTGSGTPHHEGVLGLMILTMLAILRVANTRINRAI